MVFRQTGLLRRVSTHPKDTRVWRLSVTSWSPELCPSLLALQLAFHFRLAQANGSRAFAWPRLMAPGFLLGPGKWLRSLCLTQASGPRALAWPMNWDEFVLGGLPKTLWTNENRWTEKGILNEVWIKPRYKPSDHLKHTHQRGFKVFVGDPFAEHWCIDFGLLSYVSPIVPRRESDTDSQSLWWCRAPRAGGHEALRILCTSSARKSQSCGGQGLPWDCHQGVALLRDGHVADPLSTPYPNLVFLAFLDFLAFFLFKELLAILSVFPFFPKDFRGNPRFFWGFCLRFSKKARKRRSGQSAP